MRDIAVLEVRNESFNVWAAVAAVVRRGVAVTMADYCVSYVRLSRPKLVLTFIDNTSTFYELKRFSPGVKFVSVQNGWRDDAVFDIWKATKANHELGADFVLCFGAAIGQKYLDCMTAHVLPIGSLKNNKVLPDTARRQEGSVLFLSQFRAPVESVAGPVMPVGARGIPWRDFYSAETVLLPLLLEFTRMRGLQLNICGCSAAHEHSQEKQFFEDILGPHGWELIQRQENLSSYRRVIEASHIVSIDSTLGVEAVGRGAKVAFFGLRGAILGTTDRSYGWEAGFAPQGPFWTNTTDRGEFERVMHYLIEAGDEEWQTDRRRFVDGVISFDPGNATFLQLMRDLGAPLNGDQCSDVRR